MALGMDQIELGDEAIAEYNERGYWIGPKMFDEKEVEELRAAVMRIVRGEKDFDCMHFGFPPRFDPTKKHLVQVLNGWWVNRKIRELLERPEIGYIASRFMNAEEVRLVHDQILYKPGLGKGGKGGGQSPGADGAKRGNGSGETGAGTDGAAEQVANVGWHQDAPHWTVFKTTLFCTAWIALQDTDLTNGGMRFVPGSHKWGFCEDAYTFGLKDLDALEKRFTPKGREWKDEPCVLAAGQVSFHSGLTFHGSGPNVTAEPRLCIVLNMLPKGTRYNAKGLYHGLGAQMGPQVKDGDPCEDPYFPRLWPPAGSG